MTTYYKVTGANGESIHGGRLQWSLPVKDGEDWTPGDWHETAAELVLCSSGLHLTGEPAAWWAEDARCFVAEYDGERVGDGGDKIAVRKARLIRELVGAELAGLQIFSEGQHVCTKGAVRAYGSATVRASDSATVEAYDSATVRAYGSATVEAFDSATVLCPPRAWGQPTVTVAGHAVWIDYRSGKPIVHAVTAEFADRGSCRMTRLRAALRRWYALTREVCHHGWRVVSGRASVHVLDTESGITRFTLGTRRKG